MAKAREVPGLDPSMAFRAAAAATVRVRAAELFDAREDVLDVEDIERVHRMRVATRRLRAVMELYRPCFAPEAFGPVLRDIKALADALGARRDPDVQLASLEELAAALPRADLAGIDLAAEEARTEQARGNELLAVALAEVERSDLHGRLLALLADAPEPEPVASSPEDVATTPSGADRLGETAP